LKDFGGRGNEPWIP